MNTIADKLVMLFSTDWFFRYWELIGIPMPEGTRRLIRDACRNEVKKLIGGAEVYWFASFSEERLAETRSRLRDIFRGNADSLATVDNLLECGHGCHGSISGNQTSLLDSLTQLIVSDPESGEGLVGADLQRKVSRIWEKAETASIDFHALCAQSGTEWDQYVRSLTPDLPLMLADFLAVDVTARDRFGAFWLQFDKDSSPLEKGTLINWYETMAAMLTDQEFDAPDWMKSKQA